MLNLLLGTGPESDPEERPTEHDEPRSQALDPLLSPEERVLALLEEQNGRLRQQDIVAATGYADGTVSQLLSEMEADGQITRYWKGNGKVVALPELGPDATTP